jgi:hypothetical protein
MSATKRYNAKDIDFNSRLNGSIDPYFVKKFLMDIEGGCEMFARNILKVYEYYFGEDSLRTGKGKTVKGIVCEEALLKRNDRLCRGCKFYGEDEKTPVYEYKGDVV